MSKPIPLVLFALVLATWMPLAAAAGEAPACADPLEERLFDHPQEKLFGCLNRQIACWQNCADADFWCLLACGSDTWCQQACSNELVVCWSHCETLCI